MPLVELVTRPEQFVTTVVFLLLACQLVQATLVGILADRLFGVVGLVVAIAIDVIVVFVVAEAAPKTWAVLNPERAGPGRGPPGAPRWPSSRRSGWPPAASSGSPTSCCRAGG